MVHELQLCNVYINKMDNLLEGDGEVNLWDHFTEDSNTKKTELSEDNGWSTWTEGASRKNAPSYRAWRGSALGPTMSRLRSKQGK